jgi:hypothetical protein
MIDSDTAWLISRAPIFGLGIVVGLAIAAALDEWRLERAARVGLLDLSTYKPNADQSGPPMLLVSSRRATETPVYDPADRFRRVDGAGFPDEAA